MQEFLDANPGVTIELVTEDQPIKMVDEGIDLAFKVGNRLPDSSVAKKIGVVQNYFCASPDFLKKSRKISRPSDLEKVNFLVNTYLGSNIQLVGPEGKKATVNVRGRFISRNTFINCRSCLRGDGVAMLPAEFAQNYMIRANSSGCCLSGKVKNTGFTRFTRIGLFPARRAPFLS